MESKAYQCDVGDDKQVIDTLKKVDDELGPVTGLIAVSVDMIVERATDTIYRTLEYQL